MKSKYHIQITKKALGANFSEDALKTVVRANVLQDRPIYQFNHDHFHFDGSAFAAGYEYILKQERIIIDKVSAGDYREARKAFGRILHTWQDFYSHSNYVPLWTSQHPERLPEDINPADDTLIQSPALRSGKNYGVTDMLALMPIISKLVTPKMPEDSHAKMNMDSPETSSLFPFAFAAAKKRTQLIYNEIIHALVEAGISEKQILEFTGKEKGN